MSTEVNLFDAPELIQDFWLFGKIYIRLTDFLFISLRQTFVFMLLSETLYQLHSTLKTVIRCNLHQITVFADSSKAMYLSSSKEGLKIKLSSLTIISCHQHVMQAGRGRVYLCYFLILLRNFNMRNHIFRKEKE